MKRFAVSILIVFAVSVSLIVRGGEFPSTTPEDVGMSSERLGRIDDYVERHLEAHHFAGAVTLVARRGQIVQFKAYGMQDIEAQTDGALKPGTGRLYAGLQRLMGDGLIRPADGESGACRPSADRPRRATRAR